MSIESVLKRCQLITTVTDVAALVNWAGIGELCLSCKVGLCFEVDNGREVTVLFQKSSEFDFALGSCVCLVSPACEPWYPGAWDVGSYLVFLQAVTVCAR